MNTNGAEPSLFKHGKRILHPTMGTTILPHDRIDKIPEHLQNANHVRDSLIGQSMVLTDPRFMDVSKSTYRSTTSNSFRAGATAHS